MTGGAGPARLVVEVRRTTALRFDDGAPVRAASGIASFGDGWLVAQDDATSAAWWRDDAIARVRLFPPVDGHDRFSEASGTKHLKPDVEAACSLGTGDRSATLLLGSGSLAPRTRAALVDEAGRGGPRVRTADLAALYDRVGEALEVPPDRRNLEGACVVGDRLRWFQRGDVRNDVANSSVDVDLAGLVAAVAGDAHPSEVALGRVRRYELGGLGGDVPLAITDAVVLADGRVLTAAAAEDTDDPVADGAVSASALVLLEGDAVAAAAVLPPDADGVARKVEGLAILREHGATVELLAVVDQDDPATASLALHLAVTQDQSRRR